MSRRSKALVLKHATYFGTCLIIILTTFPLKVEIKGKPFQLSMITDRLTNCFVWLSADVILHISSNSEHYKDISCTSVRRNIPATKDMRRDIPP